MGFGCYAQLPSGRGEGLRDCRQTLRAGAHSNLAHLYSLPRGRDVSTYHRDGCGPTGGPAVLVITVRQVLCEVSPWLSSLVPGPCL